MDPISIIIGLVVVAGIATVVYQSQKEDSAKPAVGKVPAKKAPVAKKAAPASTTPTKKAEPSARVKALKSSDAVKVNALNNKFFILYMKFFLLRINYNCLRFVFIKFVIKPERI